MTRAVTSTNLIIEDRKTMRSQCFDWAAEVAFFPSEIIEHALAHKLKDEAEAAYQRGTMLTKRAALMEQWAEFCGDAALSVDVTLGTAA